MALPPTPGLDPGKGASAIHELAHQIVRSSSCRIWTAASASTSVSIAGGSRPNVIAAERARASIDVRVPTMADAARVESAIRA